jgi:hypothetical protein
VGQIPGQVKKKNTIKLVLSYPEQIDEIIIICFLLGQLDQIDFHNASSLKQQSINAYVCSTRAHYSGSEPIN